MRRKLLDNYSYRTSSILLACGLALYIAQIWMDGAPDFMPLTGGCSVSEGDTGIYVRTTNCDDGVTGKGRLASKYFVVKDNGLQFWYLGEPTIVHGYITAQSGAVQKVHMRFKGSTTSYKNVLLDEAMSGQTVRFLVDDHSTIGAYTLGNVSNYSYHKTALSGLVDFIYMLALVHLLICLFMAFIMRTTDYQKSLLLLPLGLGAFGYLAFAAYYADRVAGYTITGLFLLCCLQGARALVSDKFSSQAKIINQTILPVSCYTMLILALGYFPFTHGIADDFAVAAVRWRDLPVDNWLSKVFADQVWKDAIRVPMIPGWLSSDRPPLQAGVNLLLFPLAKTGLAYQTLSSFLQALVFLPVVLLIRQLKLQRVAFWVLLGLALSSLLAVHTLFVWPKLISATYLLIVYLLLLTPYGQNLSKENVWIYAGLSGAFAMLCHGGAIFGLIPIFLLGLIRNLGVFLKRFVPAGILMVVAYSPWIAYQKIIDPPGNLLAKWHLAGMPTPNKLSLFDALKQQAWAQNKSQNIDMILGRVFDIFDWFLVALQPPLSKKAIDTFQSASFGHLFFSYWFMSPLLLVPMYAWLLLRRRTDRELNTLVLTSIVGLVVWVVLIFLPGSTSVHHGTFFLWIALFLCASAAATQINTKLLIALVALNTLVFCQYYVFDKVYIKANTDTAFYLTIIGSMLMIFLTTLYKACQITESRQSGSY